MRTIPLPWTTVFANHETDPTFVPCTPWFSVSNTKEVQVIWEMVENMNASNMRPGYQVAIQPDSPGNVYGIGSFQTTNDVFWPSSRTNVTTNTDGLQLVRFGFEGKNASGQGTSLNLAVAGGKVKVLDKV